MKDNPFDKQLHSYNDKIQNDLNRGVEIEEIERNLSDLVNTFAQDLEVIGRITEPHKEEDGGEGHESYYKKIQQEIARVQIEKKLIIDQLKEDIRKLDDEAEIEHSPHAYQVTFTSDGDSHFCVNDNDMEYKLTWGMIMSGISWGLEYDFDSSVPRRFRKRYLLEKAKNRINNLYQIQLAKYLRSVRDDNPLGKSRISYKNLEDILIKGGVDELDQGHKSERIVECLLVRYADDHPSYFTIDPTSVMNDVKFKSDFVLRRVNDKPQDQSGSKVYDSIGIQWYSPDGDGGGLRDIRNKFVKTKKKLADTDFKDHGIDAIKFVISPFDVNKIFDQWSREKPPFSPDVYLDKQVQMRIVVQCLSGILSHAEIAEMLDISIENISSLDSEGVDMKIDSIGDPVDTEDAILNVLASGDKKRIEKGLRNTFFCNFVMSHLQDTRGYNQDFVYSKLVEFGYGPLLLENILGSGVGFDKDNLIAAFDASGKLDLLRPHYDSLGLSVDDENRVTLTRALSPKF